LLLLLFIYYLILFDVNIMMQTSGACSCNVVILSLQDFNIIINNNAIRHDLLVATSKVCQNRLRFLPKLRQCCSRFYGIHVNKYKILAARKNKLLSVMAEDARQLTARTRPITIRPLWGCPLDRKTLFDPRYYKTMTSSLPALFLVFKLGSALFKISKNAAGKQAIT
jgi:hypothetical protein